MLETTRIRREGYSYRPPFAEFLDRFAILAFPATAQPLASAAACERVLHAAGITGWVLGQTKVHAYLSFQYEFLPCSFFVDTYRAGVPEVLACRAA